MNELTQKDLKAISGFIETVNKLHWSNLESSVSIDIPETITLSSGSRTLGTLAVSEYSDEYVFTPHYEKPMQIRQMPAKDIPLPPPLHTYNP